MKNIDGLFFGKRCLFLRLFGKKVHKLNGLLIRSRHGLDVFEIERILGLSSIDVDTSGRVHSYAVDHVGMSGCESVGQGIVVGWVVAVGVVAHDAIAVTGSGGGVDCCCDLDTLVFYLLEIHFFHPVYASIRCISVPNPVRPVSDVYIPRVLQIQCRNVGRLRCFGHRRSSDLP